MNLPNWFKAGAVAVTTLLAAAPLPALAQSADQYPTGMIKWIVPYPAGGIPDRLARAFGEKLREAWGQTVIVENMPGANSLIGNEALARSAPDGHTMIMLTPVIAVGRTLYPTANWPEDPLSIFAPVSRMIKTSNVIVVPAASEYKTIADLISRTKAAAQPELFGVPSIGSAVHLGMEEFAERTGMKLQVVPFKGGPQLIGDLVGGHIGLAADNLSNALPHIRSGRARALMVMSPTRNPVAPEIPSTADAGWKDFESASWQGVAVRAGTPKPIIDKISREIQRIGKLPELKARFEDRGDTLETTTPEEFTSLIRSESMRMSALIKRRNIKGQ
jgi:tripartite-type tricarboxylate transporter receptor subunit TctC